MGLFLFTIVPPRHSIFIIFAESFIHLQKGPVSVSVGAPCIITACFLCPAKRIQIEMGLPRLNSCCWVLDLKTGNIVLGCLNAFLSFIMFVVMIVIAVAVSSEENIEVEEGINLEEQAAMTGLYAMSIILVFMFLAKFLFDVLFIYGVINERAAIIKAYFIMWLVFFLLSMFTFSINLPYYSAATICTEVFYIGLNVYAILVSHSFYKNLNEREEV